MTATLRRGGAAFLAVLTALLMTLALASAASAHGGTGNAIHDDAAGNHSNCDGDGTSSVPAATSPDTSCSAAHTAAHPGSSTLDPVSNDSPSDAVGVIRDYGLENAPIIVTVIGAIFLVGLTFYLIRRGLMKARGAMRL